MKCSCSFIRAGVGGAGRRADPQRPGRGRHLPGGTLDPSGYVKGWAIQTASDILLAGGSTNHSVNGGGDVQCVGDSAPGQPWRNGVTHPQRPGDLVAGSGIAVATSGTSERGHHVLNPHTQRAPLGLGLAVAGLT